MTIAGKQIVSSTVSRLSISSIKSQRTHLMGRISRRGFERRSRSTEVQELIGKARRTWKQRYGVDPAAVRLRERA